MWTVSELQLLVGTTLAPAISSKLKANRREYDLLCTSAANTRWYQAVQEQLDFDDWLQVDAMYRSRALDFPGIGHCMVPCVDLANHASHEDTVAIYEKDEDSNTVLLLRDGKTVKEGDEVTITYGDEKGACEMLFSYGFLEDGMRSAETLFLSLAIPHDDPQQMAKMKIADSAPGFKLVDAGNGRLDWNGEFIWLLCVNQEDGLRFQLARTVDGEGEEIHGFFGDHELTGGATELYSLLSKSELWDVYRLRAITILQQRVFDQLQVLYSTQEDMENVPYGANTDVRERPYKLAMKLRELEFDLLNTAYEDFEKQVSETFRSDLGPAKFGLSVVSWLRPRPIDIGRTIDEAGADSADRSYSLPKVTLSSDTLQRSTMNRLRTMTSHDSHVNGSMYSCQDTRMRLLIQGHGHYLGFLSLIQLQTKTLKSASEGLPDQSVSLTCLAADTQIWTEEWKLS